MPTTIHLVLAYISAVATTVVAAEAAWRALRDRPATALSRVLGTAQLVSLVITALAGFALIAGGAEANNGLHYLIAVAALLAVPIAPMFAMTAGRRTRAAVTCIAAVLALALVAVVFATG